MFFYVIRNNWASASTERPKAKCTWANSASESNNHRIIVVLNTHTHTPVVFRDMFGCLTGDGSLTYMCVCLLLYLRSLHRLRTVAVFVVFSEWILYNLMIIFRRLFGIFGEVNEWKMRFSRSQIRHRRAECFFLCAKVWNPNTFDI